MATPGAAASLAVLPACILLADDDDGTVVLAPTIVCSEGDVAAQGGINKELLPLQARLLSRVSALPVQPTDDGPRGKRNKDDGNGASQRQGAFINQASGSTHVIQYLTTYTPQ